MKYKNEISLVAKKLINNGFGFRNDMCYNSGIIDFEEILNFEVKELCNTDIFQTCYNLYQIDGCNDCRKKKKNIESILMFFRNHLKTVKIYGLWLTTFDMVKMLYGTESNEISRYILNKDCLIASDLGGDGVLFVSKNHFNKI